MAKMTKSVLDKAEHIVEKADNAGSEAFLLRII